MEKFIIEDSGEREVMSTGAVRDTQENKGRFDLISPYAMLRLAQHYEAGAKKYDERNWEKGILASRCFSSCLRHLFKWIAGERTEDHLTAAVWNLCCIIHYEHAMPEMIDTPQSKEREVIK